MDNMHPSEGWTGEAPPDSYYEAWIERLAPSKPLRFAIGIGTILLGALIGWLNRA